ncbi:MAG: hypothetical protein IJJ86_04350 [Clostridia bacterium]|nr:hypothetical protein [Clostridia bacterium]
MKRFMFKAAAYAVLFGMLFGCAAQKEASAVPSAPAQTAEAQADPDVIEITTAVPETPVPTPEPTPEPTPKPTPEPTPEPERITCGKLDGGAYDAYFDDALLIGDSLTKALGGYTRGMREKDPSFLGAAQFMGTISMSVKKASADKSDPGGITFMARGKAVSLTEGIRKYGAKKVFILLGMNDLDYRRWEDVEENFRTLIDRIRDACPDVEIVIESILPVTKGYSRKIQIPIAQWNGFNEVLKGVCEEKNVAFLSFSDQLMDEEGYLLAEYADGGYHLNADGNAVWVRALRLYAAKRLYPDGIVDLSE